MKTAPFAILAFLLTACAPAISTNNSPAPDGGPAAALTRVKRGSTLRLFRSGQPPLTANFLSAERDSITVGTNDRNLMVAIAGIDSAWVRVNRSGQGAVIGGLTLGAVGAVFFGALAAGMCDAADCSGVGAKGAAVGGALGLLAGGGIGALIGTAASRWEPVYRAPRRSLP